MMPKQRPIAPIQPLLRLQGDGAHFPALALLPSLDGWSDPRHGAVMMGGFDQRSATGAVAGLGDGALLAFLATGIFAGSQAEVTHELAGRIESRQVASFG